MRELNVKSHYDLVIVGGGIQGCAMVWEAQSRGLNTLLVEAEDYCSQTSANSLKTIHGGIRYLQTLDLARTIRSAREQEVLLKIAPHLIKQLPCLLPTERKLKRSRLAVSTGFGLYNLIKAITCPGRKLPKARWISKSELNQYAQVINDETVTGAGLWYDAQVQHAERLGLAFVKTAQNAGADAFNYLKAESLAVINKNQFQLNLKCQIKQTEYHVSADNVIFCSAAKTAENISGFNFDSTDYPDFCMAMNLVVNHHYEDTAIGLQSGFAQKNTSSSNRLLFAAPWRDKTLFGTWYFNIDSQTERSQQPNTQQIEFCLNEVNSTYPQINLNLDDLSQIHHGLLPVKGEKSDPNDDLKETDLLSKPDDQLNLFAVIPTKYTTCRAIAEQVIDKLSGSNHLKIRQSISAEHLLIGANDQNKEPTQKYDQRLDRDTFDQLISVYGGEIDSVLEYCQSDQELADQIPGSNNTIKAQLQYELDKGQVEKLSDFLARRTFLASDQKVNSELLNYCSDRIYQARGTKPDFEDEKRFFNE